MTTHSHSGSTTTLAKDPGFQAFWALRLGFAILPILMGLDKFVNVMMDDWTVYLADVFNDIVPGDAATAMNIVGVVEIVGGVVVLLLPRIGAPIVAAWLIGIIVNLLIIGGYGDIALRDIGLFLAAVVLTRLAWAYPNDLLARRTT